MDTEKVRVVDTIYTQEQKRVETFGEGLHVKGDVTFQNGTVTSIESITVTDPSAPTQEDGHGLLWSGYANPTLGGSYYTQGREMEVLTAVMEFINAVRN